MICYHPAHSAKPRLMLCGLLQNILASRNGVIRGDGQASNNKLFSASISSSSPSTTNHMVSNRRLLSFFVGSHPFLLIGHYPATTTSTLIECSRPPDKSSLGTGIFKRRFHAIKTYQYHCAEASNLRPKVELATRTNIERTISTMTKMAKIISGMEVADEIRTDLKQRVSKLHIKPRLVIVQVGEREDSNVYIRMKVQFAESIGAQADVIKLDRTVSQVALAAKIKELNADESIHGIITQLPFDCEEKIAADNIVDLIAPNKDVDGLSTYSAGRLVHGNVNSSRSFTPCTPRGCMELLKKAGIEVAGARSVVIGRSKIVGSPMAQLLLWNNSTVTICHSKTKNIEDICRQADIIVAAVGQPLMVKKSWLKPGAVVIDCGINVLPDPNKKSGTRLVGDVDFEGCKEVASAITPVPGGVGPMTVAMLILNTVTSAERVNG